ncbi:LysR family transcriptional regulator [Paenibacillus psychroresistens]|uniref:LysR family transcriptional regulator n=1 Tax=Paenibacillus psychroresistens TaxID=1778678 RepID=A0A6B8RHI7_9BACL|nr:LysR family transcriptional regulator [Paenibacillus psychroresistens]QGQ95065.1 LysR family transcriptional regulator [Paenibacillus psychroresistens]
MDLRTIKTFKTIIKLGSFQRAAEELQYVQSTVTTHIQKLESDLGVKLIERGKNLRLTEAGRLFSEKSDSLIKDYDYLNHAMNEFIKGESGVVRLGIMEPTASYRIPLILAPFMQLYPKLQISIQIGNTSILSEMLDNGIIDIAICTTPESGVGSSFEPLFVEKLGLLVHQSHPLAIKEDIYLHNLQNENLLLTTSTCPYRKKLERSLLEKGGSPYLATEIGSMAALKYYVQANFGLAVVPLISVTPLPEGTILKELRDLDSGLITGMLRKKESPPFNSAGERLIAFLRQELLNFE